MRNYKSEGIEMNVDCTFHNESNMNDVTEALIVVFVSLLYACINDGTFNNLLTEYGKMLNNLTPPEILKDLSKN